MCQFVTLADSNKKIMAFDNDESNLLLGLAKTVVSAETVSLFSSEVVFDRLFDNGFLRPTNYC